MSLSIRRAARVTGLAAIVLSAIAGVAACGWDPQRPFDRNSPVVNEAIAELDGGDAGSATAILTDYLSTGACSEGSIGTPLLVRSRPNGGVDLGLSLFKVAEGFGQRFGDEEKKDSITEQARAARGGDIECARKIVKAIAEDDNVPVDLRARARYVEGNLLFLDAKYKDAVTAYDQSLTLAPGMADAGTEVGRDAAWNRAIALRRIEDQKDAGQDAAPDASKDASDDGSPPPDGGQKGDGGDPGKDGGGNNGDGGNDDKNKDGGGDDDKQPPDAGKQPPQGEPSSMDERVLDKLENAPTVQQEAAKKQAQKRRVRVPIDK